MRNKFDAYPDKGQKIVGVNYDKARDRWRASVTRLSQTQHLGHYLTKADCVEAVELGRKTDKAQLPGTTSAVGWDFEKDGGNLAAAKFAFGLKFFDCLDSFSRYRFNICRLSPAC